ncbi:arsenic transporter [Salmonella enterica]|nr:arsenic transporter [Salmonella enterica]EGY0630726.1 arsenic transporter [Salmonella enterica]
MFANADSKLILTPIIIAVLLAPGFSKSTTLAILHFFFRREK